jgi:nicotinamide-nucleotide amidase
VIAMVADAVNTRIDTLLDAVADKLLRRQLTCATAESCTGGWIAQTLTTVEGSSAWFECGFVTYSDASKTRLLGVEAALIRQFGAVSEQVAKAMALGAVTHSPALVAVSVTGIAGPEGGSPQKPVGTVVFGWIVPGMTDPDVERILFKGNREGIRWKTVVHALAGLNQRL